jgi:hypothetical protein
MESAPEGIQNPNYEGQYQAHDNARHDRKVEAAAAPLHHDISRKPPQPKRQFDAKHKQCARSGENNTDSKQEFPEFAKRIHRQPFYLDSPRECFPSERADTQRHDSRIIRELDSIGWSVPTLSFHLTREEKAVSWRMSHKIVRKDY